ncbi:MAG: Excinuclease subunit domain protein [Bacillales bacterium]|jgi:hypothetical protein|nr:Excinuclease subunit domain protein [Bacillales bacterium]
MNLEVQETLFNHLHDGRIENIFYEGNFLKLIVDIPYLTEKINLDVKHLTLELTKPELFYFYEPESNLKFDRIVDFKKLSIEILESEIQGDNLVVLCAQNNYGITKTSYINLIIRTEDIRVVDSTGNIIEFKTIERAFVNFWIEFSEQYQYRKKLLNYEFEFVQELAPVRDINGDIKLFSPHLKLIDNKRYILHKYGEGPFCRFSIHPKWDSVSGVYAYFFNNELVYIGQCLNFLQRFNNGYGNISPRSCVSNQNSAGQSTNCKMNKAVLNQYLSGDQVFLYFLVTTDYDKVEYELIQHYKPKLNTARTQSKLVQKKEKEKSVKKLNDFEKNQNVKKDIKKNLGKKEIVKYLEDYFEECRFKGFMEVDVVSGDIHSKLNLKNCMPTVCAAMYSMMKSNDKVLNTTPSGFSSTIAIKYKL